MLSHLPRSLRVFALLFALLLSALAGLLAAGPARAGVVTTTADDGTPGTLRSQIAAASSGDTITFASNVTGTIALRSGELDISRSVTITGPGANVLAVDGGHASRVFGVTGGTVTISGLTVQNGNSRDGGGGVFIASGAVTMAGCTLTNNSAGSTDIYNPASGVGGGIANYGSLTLTGCTLANNSSPNGGGGIYNGGPLTAASCVLVGNSANNSSPDGGGGGILSGGYDTPRAAVTLTNCTLTGNSVGNIYGGPPASGGGVSIVSGAATLTNDILYGDTGGEVNGAAPASYCDIQGSGGTPGSPDASLNFSADPKFVSATDLHLQSGSPCVGMGTSSAPAFDSADRDGVLYGVPPSIGAYELPSRAAPGYVVTNLYDSGPGSLRAAVAYAQAAPPNVVTFRNGLSGTILLTSGQIVISGSLSIVGLGAGVLAVDGGYASRVFGITSGAGSPVTISGLTVQNGQAPQNPYTDYNFQGCGGGICAAGYLGTVTVTGCTFSGNTASTNYGSGGGINNQNGSTLTLAGCTFVGNHASGGGGAVANVGTVSASDCTFTGNTDVAFVNDGAATVTGCAFSGNRSGLLNFRGGVTVTGCTFTGNSAPYSNDAGGVTNSGGTATLTNDILYGDAGGEIASGPFYSIPAALSATYCDVQGGVDANDAANHILNADPKFVSATDPHLQSGSLCVGMGTRSAPAFDPEDHDGIPYGLPPSVGAYELPSRAAPVYVVTNLYDSGPGSLRAAAAYAQTSPDRTITFLTGLSGTIALTSGEIDISQSVTVPGPGAGVLAVDGGHASRVFAVTGGTVAVSGLTVQNGQAPSSTSAPFFSNGGGVAVSGGSLALTACTLAGNISHNGGGAAAAAGGGSLTLTDCTLTGNLGGSGSALFNNPTGTATLVGCTLQGNRATGTSALFNEGVMTVTGCTLTGNTGGTAVIQVKGTTTLTDDILYGDSGGEVRGSITASYCDIGQVPGVYAGTGNLNADPKFVSAADLHLQSGSPCIGGGTSSAPAYSPTDHDGFLYGSPPSLGAYEPKPLALAGLTFPTPVPGGTAVIATVTLTRVTPADLVVGLSSSSSAAIRVHRAVTVPAGASSATFTINTYRSHVTQTVTVQARLGPVALTKDLTIMGQ